MLEDINSLWDTRQTAEYLGVAPKTIANWCSKKILPYYKVGRYRRFKKKDLDDWLQDCRKS